ncbi:DUF6959 family protein [Xanthomonas campestris]|uniref:DUF6959 family protein n=1 Tax=Xanthomonas campestris TaxID=339 RepID=UPI0012904B0F|nr:hypothetical protein [Xanthomonas campestris]
MKRKATVTIYGDLGNNIALHFPERRGPAVAIQKDTLKSIIEDLHFSQSLLSGKKFKDAEDEFRFVIEKLEGIYKDLIKDTAEDFG